MGQMLIEGVTTNLETTVYAVIQPNTLGILNSLRFNCSLASVVTISNLRNSIEYDLYTLTLDEGDTVNDTYLYYLNQGDEFIIKADVIGITYTVNVTQA
jgi:hypothetical protein